MDSSHLTPSEVAKRWNITTKTLSQWRYNGRGPHYSKVSRLITYWLPDIEEYEKRKRCRSTSEYNNSCSSDPCDQGDKSKKAIPSSHTRLPN